MPSERPLYHRVATILREEIAAGRPPVGEALPGEATLCERFGASRFTVRAALAALADDGLIARRAGARTVVIARQPHAVFTQTVVSLDELMNYPADTRRETLSKGIVAVEPDAAVLLGCAPGREWFRIVALRRAASRPWPLCWTEIFLRPDYAAVARRPDHERTHVVEQVQCQFGEVLTRARVDLAPASIPAALAEPLQVAAGTPALLVTRRYHGQDGRLFEMTRSWHPEGRYAVSLDLNRRPQGSG